MKVQRDKPRVRSSGVAQTYYYSCIAGEKSQRKRQPRFRHDAQVRSINNDPLVVQLFSQRLT
jgi:hypothetical protein